MNEAQTAVLAAERSSILARNGQELEFQLNRITKAWENAEKGRNIYAPLPQTKEEEGLWKQFVPAWETWKKKHQHVMELVKTGKKDEALEYSRGSCRESFLVAEELLGKITTLNQINSR
jgi:methyl-accepting chemotaxis protein